MNIPAYLLLRLVTLLLSMLGLALFWLASISDTSSMLANHSTAMLLIGIVLLLIAMMGPVRVIYHGAQIPVEIRRTVAVQAFVLLFSGVTCIVAARFGTATAEAWGFFVVGGLMLVSAWAGLYPLSTKLPHTFYVGEMLRIIASAGITADKKHSPANQALQRWTQGRRDGLPVGDVATDGVVMTMQGESVLLSTFFTQQPLVLNFASYSCPHHRKRIPELQQLMQKWQGCGVNFLTVYVAEAHPEDGWKLAHQYDHDEAYTKAEDFCFYYAKNMAERQQMGALLMNNQGFPMQVVLDSMENELLQAYNAWPIRLYIIAQGKIAYCGEQGPFGYAPASVDRALKKMIL